MYRKSIRTPMLNSYSYYFTSVLICLLVGLTASLITKPEIISWYSNLKKPDFTPPNWLFEPVWFTLYILMGIAWGHIRNQQSNLKGISIENTIFCTQLFLNFLWSFIHFGAHEIGIAWAEINLLCLLLLITTKRFFKISKFAGWLIIPYLGWTIFANILNGSIWYLNR